MPASKPSSIPLGPPTASTASSHHASPDRTALQRPPTADPRGDTRIGNPLWVVFARARRDGRANESDRAGGRIISSLALETKPPSSTLRLRTAIYGPRFDWIEYQRI